MLLCVPLGRNSVERRNSWSLCNERVVWDGVETSMRPQILHLSPEPFLPCGFDGPSAEVNNFDGYLMVNKCIHSFVDYRDGCIFPHASTSISFSVPCTALLVLPFETRQQTHEGSQSKGRGPFRTGLEPSLGLQSWSCAHVRHLSCVAEDDESHAKLDRKRC